MKVYPMLGERISWNIGCASHVFEGVDPFVGDEGNYLLSNILIFVLNHKNIQVFAQLHKIEVNDEYSTYWLSARYLELSDDMEEEWNRFLSTLHIYGIYLRDEEENHILDW